MGRGKSTDHIDQIRYSKKINAESRMKKKLSKRTFFFFFFFFKDHKRTNEEVLKLACRGFDHTDE